MKNSKDLQIRCPICGSTNVEFHDKYYDLPYVGKAYIYSLVCKDCGYKKRDIILLEVKEPVRISFTVEKPEDLYTKVIRSHSARIILPEVGIEINPGVAAETFITNVEGLIRRVLDVVEMAKRFNERDKNEEGVRNAQEIIDYLNRVLEGKEKLTIILEDKFGNSMILSDKAKKERL